MLASSAVSGRGMLKRLATVLFSAGPLPPSTALVVAEERASVASSGRGSISRDRRVARFKRACHTRGKSPESRGP